MMLSISIAAVTKNKRLAVIAAFLSFFLFTVSVVVPYCDDASSEIISSMIAKTTNSKLRSETVKGGSCMVYPSSIWYSIWVVLVSWFRVSFWMVMGFPVALANVHAMALVRRQPTCLWVFG